MRTVRPRWLAFALLALPLSLEPRAAAAGPVSVKPLTLPNGLEVFVRPIVGAKDVALVVVFRVGARHDPAGKSGLAHLVEHCYVTAAAGDAPARGYADLVGRYPDGHNAQTADLHTIVAQVFPPERLEHELKDAAARMQDLRVTADDLAREKPRVLEEVANMFDRIPALAARNRARERVLPTHDGGRRGGLPKEVEALTLEDVRGFWSRHYKPGNAVLALAGAVDAGSALSKVGALFGPLPRGEVPRASPARGQPDFFELLGTDDLEVAPVPGLKGEACAACAAPSPDSRDFAAFLVFAARLADPNPAPGTPPPTVRYAPLDEPGALYLSVPLDPGVSADEAETAVARLDWRASEVVAEPWSPADGPRVTAVFGFLLGLVDPPDAALAANPYGVALGLAARRALGIDPAALQKSLDHVKSRPLSKIAAELFDPLRNGQATVRVRK